MNGEATYQLSRLTERGGFAAGEETRNAGSGFPALLHRVRDRLHHLARVLGAVGFP
jgi:hypothetical protein